MRNRDSAAGSSPSAAATPGGQNQGPRGKRLQGHGFLQERRHLRGPPQVGERPHHQARRFKTPPGAENPRPGTPLHRHLGVAPLPKTPCAGFHMFSSGAAGRLFSGAVSRGRNLGPPFSRAWFKARRFPLRRGRLGLDDRRVLQPVDDGLWIAMGDQSLGGMSQQLRMTRHQVAAGVKQTRQSFSGAGGGLGLKVDKDVPAQDQVHLPPRLSQKGFASSPPN